MLKKVGLCLLPLYRAEKTHDLPEIISSPLANASFDNFDISNAARTCSSMRWMRSDMRLCINIGKLLRLYAI